MKLTEQIQLRKTPELSKVCHLAKNLYNTANFHYRQFLFHLDEFITYYDLQVILKKSEAYKSLPAQTSQQTLRLVIKNWKSYWHSLKQYKKEPNKFLGRPRLPKYKKKNGESIVIFTNQNTRIKNGHVHFPKSTHLPPLKTRITQYQQIRIVPKGNYYVAEIIYNKEEIDLGLDKTRILSIDLGVDNLLATANNIGLPPLIVNGKIIKSINQYYNKIRAITRSKVDSNDPETKRMHRITRKRNNKIHDFFHKTSRKTIEYCIQQNIGMIVIGYNENWKQKVKIGKMNTQNFVSIPFLKLISMIEYKAKLVGIKIVLTDESYTSKCSALDLEPIEKRVTYCGKRITRGLFKTKNGIKVNADVNGAFNILRKVVSITQLGKEIEAVVLQPQIIYIS